MAADSWDYGNLSISPGEGGGADGIPGDIPFIKAANIGPQIWATGPRPDPVFPLPGKDEQGFGWPLVQFDHDQGNAMPWGVDSSIMDGLFPNQGRWSNKKINSMLKAWRQGSKNGTNRME